MNTNDKKSLKETIKKRQTQQILNTIQEKKQPQSQQRTSSVERPRPPAPNRVSQQLSAVIPPAHVASRSNLSRHHLRLIIGLSAVLLILLVLAGILGAALPPASTVQPTYPPLPTFNADNIAAHLFAVGVPIVDSQPIDPTILDLLQAHEGISLRVTDHTTVRQVLILSYPSEELAYQGAFRRTLSDTYKQWHPVNASNILLLASPSISASFLADLTGHFRQYVVAPYREFMPTSTSEHSVQP